MTPTTTKALIEAGYKINVERSASRIFIDEEFVAVGATLVAEGSWPEAPIDNIIVGLKELSKDSCAYLCLYFSSSSTLELVQVMNLADLPFLVPLVHSHIQFGHCYKDQEGWADYLDRFARGGGILYDIEFLTDASGKRVSAFGYYAGYAGAAVSLLA